MRRLHTVAAALILTLVLLWAGLEQRDALANYTLLSSSWPTPSAPWKANPNFPVGAGTTTEQLTALQNAADAWTTQACSNFQFSYGGTTTLTVSNDDGTNAVYYTSVAGAGTLAVCLTRFIGSTTQSFDIRFFGDVTWHAVTAPSGVFDIQGVATHEFGHALGLGHDDSANTATMWPSVGSGASSTAWRSLEATDIAGAVFLYGLDPLCGGSSFGPDPMSFAAPPNQINATTVLLSATPAGPGAAEYLFDYTGILPGGSDSVWQTSSVYVDTGLEPNALHSWRVKARLAANTAIETAWSPIATVITPAATPGVPVMGAIGGDTAYVGALATGANPPATTYALKVGTSWVGPTGLLQATEHWATAANWAGKPIKGLTPQTAYSLAAKARNLIFLETPLGGAAGFSTVILPTSAAGSTQTAGGALENVFTINGSSGGTLRQVTIPMGNPVTFAVAQPSQNGSFANFIIWARFGIPLESAGHDFPVGIGRLCYVPCDYLPLPESFLLFSTYGPLNCIPFAGSYPAPFSVTHPGLNFPILDLVLQGLVEQTPGVLRTTNAVVMQNM